MRAAEALELNFIQHVFTILKQHGRAAIVVPDNDSHLPSCSPFGLPVHVAPVPRLRRTAVSFPLGVALSVMTHPMQLVPPSLDRLPSYVAALKRGWSPDNIKGAAASIEEITQIEKDPRSFVESLTDREAKGPPIVLPDGSSAARLPGFRLWLWDTEFCGSIGLRWQPDTSELPPHVLGHIGYAVVPWKEGRGYAKLALKLMLEHARAQGLEYVEITTDPNNVASRRVIEANGGLLIERFQRPAQYGGTDAVRYRITL